MKKELLALGLLLLILLGNLWNQRRLTELTSEIQTRLEASYRSASSRDWTKAAEDALAAEGSWLNARGYTHIFIRHTDIDALTAAFCGYRGAIAGQDDGDILSAYLLLTRLLSSLQGMEKLSPGSIL